MTSESDSTLTADIASTADEAVDDASEDAAKAEGKKHEKINWIAELRGLALMLLAVLAFHTFVAKPFYIPSGSMMPNLLVGDRLVVSKYPYGWSWVSASFHVLPRGDWRLLGKTPQYGDVVIAVPPDKSEDYIKRVIGLPGDTVQVRNSRVILNGKVLPRTQEPPVQLPVDQNSRCEDYGSGEVRLTSGKLVCEYFHTYREWLPNGANFQIIDNPDSGPYDNTQPVTVPEGYVFLMGDNRDHSSDSRAPSGDQQPGANGLGGPVPLTSVGGRAEFITFSLDGSASWNPLSWFTDFRSGRAGTSLRPPLLEPATGGNAGDGHD